MTARGGLARANLVVATGTLLSRLSGLVRFGFLVQIVANDLADAFTTANNLPNVLYELVLGGVLAATLVPLFTRHATDGDTEATSAVFSVAAVASAVLTVAAVIASPLLVRLYTVTSPDTVDRDRLVGTMTFLAAVFLPQVFFYALTFLASALLNAHGRFFAAAWAPVVNNVVGIAGLAALAAVVGDTPRDLALAAQDPTLRWLLAAPTTAGIVVMAGVLLVSLRRNGIVVRFRPDRHHPAVREVLRLSGWTIGYVAANQLALYAMTVLARPGSFGVTAYQVAFLLAQVPIGLLAMSVITTFTPELARARAARDKARFLARFEQGLRLLLAVMLPAGFGLAVLARPLVSILLQAGAFDAADAEITGATLTAFAWGVGAVAAYLFVLRGFTTHADTRTPFVVNAFENALNILLGVALVGTFGVPGLAWSFTIAYGISSVGALAILARKLPGVPVRRLLGSAGRLGLAALVMAEVVWLATSSFGGTTGGGALARLVVGIPLGVAVYLAGLVVLRAPELREAAIRLRLHAR